MIKKDFPWKTTHIFLATPMYGGLAHSKYIEGLLGLSNASRELGFRLSFCFMGNESLITRARNALAFNFLKSPATHLLFVDADIGFRPIDVVKMIQSDCDIIAGVYPKKDINWPAVGRAVRGNVPDENLWQYTGNFVINVDNVPEEGFSIPTEEPFAVRNAGTGLMLIKRRVFDELRDKVPAYKNNMSQQNESLFIADNMIHEYFSTSIDPEHNVLLSEDYHFCQLWKRNGGQIYIAPWADLTHNGTYEFSGHFQRT